MNIPKADELDELTDLATWKRRAIEAESKLRTYNPRVVELSELAIETLLAEPKPTEVVLMKCRLCDQLQADLTARDEEIDALRLDAERYRWFKSKFTEGFVIAKCTEWSIESWSGDNPDGEIDKAMTKEANP